jgi:peptidyl-prolyl cis-trans isomerase SurA
MWGGAAQAVTVDRVAAVVNEEVVTLSEVYELGRAFIDERARGGTETDRRSAELEVLDSLIRRRLITQEMLRLQIDAADIEVDRTIDDIARRSGVERDVLRTEVERGGISWPQYRDEIREMLRDQKFTQMLIRPRIVENEDEIRDAYQRMTTESDQPERVDLGAIFFGYPLDGNEDGKVATRQLAEMARKRVEGGESFAAVSAALDTGPYGANGGTMGTFVQGELVDGLDGPAFSVEVGQLSDPVETPQGVFVLEVRSREKLPLRAYDEVRDEIASKVFEGRIEREKDTWYQQARREASVEIKLEALGEK